MSLSTLQIVVLSGGSGTRLWPLSREQFPKQLLPLTGDLSLLQATAKRLDGFKAALLDPRLIVVCNEEYRFQTAEQLRQIGRTTQSIILEPAGRNTAPSLTLAALATEEDPVLLVMPADHVVGDVGAFQQAIACGVQYACNGAIVTFGISPDRPETGYGYIRAGALIEGAANPARRLEGFTEKPDAATAAKYISSGEYLWNSGIFMLRASVWLASIRRFRPDISAACECAYSNGKADHDFFRVEKEAFVACPSESIDYAVMEKTAGERGGVELVVVPMSAEWSDVGAWDALWQVVPKDGEGNAARGDTLLHDTHDSMVVAGERLVACLGVHDLIVVETADAVMVAHKDKTQDVKHIVARLKAERRPQVTAHRKVYRPWGWYDSIDGGERFQVKRIVVKPGATLSLQMHHHRAEHWVVVRGTAKVTRGDDVFLVSENESTFIPLGVKHRLENPGMVPLELIEVQSGSYLGEDDIVRFEDAYGRG